MVLSDSQLETLKTAVDRYGVTTVRNFFGITQPSLYNVIHRKNGMSSKNLLKLEELRIARKYRKYFPERVAKYFQLL